MKDVQLVTYFDSSSRSLAPPANWSFLRCQFKSWICFLRVTEVTWTDKHIRVHLSSPERSFSGGFTWISAVPFEPSRSWRPGYCGRKNEKSPGLNWSPNFFNRKRLPSRTRCRLSKRWFRTVTWAPGSRCEWPGVLTGPWSCSRTPAKL